MEHPGAGGSTREWILCKSDANIQFILKNKWTQKIS